MLRSPREHAVALVSALLEAGLEGRSVWVVDLEDFHEDLCERLGWDVGSWIAVCRELRKLGLRKTLVPFDGQRRTHYEIAPIRSDAAVIGLDRVRRAA